ncbi:hypothetical protein [Weissella hellenica]|uniref:hypothetical protein n=1 Tax=Weissella hellenica TaxID=46256 RepID=UPI00163BE649
MNIQELYDRENLSYKEYVAYLKDKYGDVVDDYYREKSYNRLLNGEIKQPTKGKFSRTVDGLITHHIKEDEYLNLSNIEWIKAFQYPYEAQAKENLVYCNLIEHAWLHMLIAEETDNKFGLPGLWVFIVPTIEDSYISEYVPAGAWRRNVYESSYLTKEEAEHFIGYLEKRVPVNHNLPQLLDDKWIDDKYPNVGKISINNKSPREKILTELFDRKYAPQFKPPKTFKDFKEFKINEFRDDLLQELDDLVKNLDDWRDDYYKPDKQ